VSIEEGLREQLVCPQLRRTLTTTGNLFRSGTLADLIGSLLDFWRILSSQVLHKVPFGFRVPLLSNLADHEPTDRAGQMETSGCDNRITLRMHGPEIVESSVAWMELFNDILRISLNPSSVPHALIRSCFKGPHL
jgi:hypothetical protein